MHVNERQKSGCEVSVCMLPSSGYRSLLSMLKSAMSCHPNATMEIALMLIVVPRDLPHALRCSRRTDP